MSTIVRSFCLSGGLCLFVSIVSMWTVQPLAAFGIESWWVILLLGGIGGLVGWIGAKLETEGSGQIFQDKAYNLLTMRQALESQIQGQNVIKHDIGELAQDLSEVVGLKNANPLKVPEDEVQKSREMVSRLSHELRTPLSSICAYTELLLDDEVCDDRERLNCYKVIHSQAHRLQHLIDTLMMLSSIDHRLIVPVTEQIDVSSLVDDVVERHTESMAVHGVNVKAVCDVEGLELVGDRELLRTCMHILLENALNRSVEGGQVKVRALPGESGETAIIEVVDRGEVIEAEDLKCAFDAYYYVGKGDMSYFSGLNLNLVKGIIEALLEGKVGVSSNIDEGTTFRIELTQPKSVTNIES